MTRRDHPSYVNCFLQIGSWYSASFLRWPAPEGKRWNAKVSSMLSSTHLQSFGYLPCHLFSHAAEVAPRFLQVAPIIQPAQFGHAILIVLARQTIHGIVREMHVAALPRGFSQELKDRQFQRRMVFADDELAPPPDPAV